MKKSLIALAALAVGGTAFAQSSVTIDGTLDITVVKPVGQNKALIESNSGYNQLRFRGTEDLGGGLKANFIIAHRFSPESGGMDGTTNGRPFWQGEATVGLSGGFGSVKLGRALTALQAPVNLSSPWSTAQAAATSGLVTGYTTEPTDARNGAGAARTDALNYTSPSFSGFTGAVSLAPKTTSGTGARVVHPKNFYSLWLAYANGPVYAGGGVEQNREGDKVAAILGTYNFGPATVMAGYSTVDNVAVAGTRGKNWNLGAAIPVGAFTFKAGIVQAKAEGTGVKTLDKIGLGLDYNLSKRTWLYTSFGRNKALATDKNGFDVGLRSSF